MRSFLIELARLAGRIALEHYQTTGLKDMDVKGRGDYVTHVDRRVEDAIASRVKAHYPDHQFLGEETHGQWPERVIGPSWIVDPIDGTTNFIRGIPHWAVSICFCDDDSRPQHAVVYDPCKEEMFIAERDAGVWLGDERVYTNSGIAVEQALVAASLPFRGREALNDIGRSLIGVQGGIDDFRRQGSAALDMAYVAVGRLDAYWELGIHPWDVAAGELLVRSGGGVATDFRNESEGLLSRRSIIAAADARLHGHLCEQLTSLHSWLSHPYYHGVAAPQ